MKKILCIGDSNVFGYIAQNGKRFKDSERWSGILKESLKNSKEKFEVIEQGLNNRTFFSKNPEGAEFCGSEYLKNLFEKDFKPFFEIIILALGINDTQIIYNKTLNDFYEEIKKTILLINEKSPKSKIILISPSNLTKNINNGHFKTMFNEKSIEKSLNLAEIYSNISKEFNNCYFADFNKIAPFCEFDGLHYDIESHKKIAEFMKNFILINYFKFNFR